MTYWNTQTLRKRIPAQGIIEPFDERRVKHAAYELAVGGEAFITSNPSEKTQLTPGAKVVIPPGQFGLLTTRETLRIPPDVIALISIRASIKFRGLVNVSGFHVDPGYAGPLKFAVYNAGSQAIVLDQGQRVFMIWFSSLADADVYPYPAKDPQTVMISAEDVARIQGDVASPASLKKQLDDLTQDLDKRFHTLQADIDKKWHATEQQHLSKKWVLGILVGASISVLLLLVKLYIDRELAIAPTMQQTPAAVAPPAVNPAAPTSPVRPDSLEGQGQKTRGG